MKREQKAILASKTKSYPRLYLQEFYRVIVATVLGVLMFSAHASDSKEEIMNKAISISSRILREARTQTGKTLQSLVSRKPTLLFFIDDACESCKLMLHDVSKKRHMIAANGATIAFVYKSGNSEAENLLKAHRLGDLPRIKDSTGDLFHAFRYHPRSFGRQYLEEVEGQNALRVLGLREVMHRSHVPCLFLIQDNEIRAASTATPPRMEQVLMDWFPDDSVRVLADWTTPAQISA